jgi:hypothetical protein
MLILACAWEQFYPNGWIKGGVGELAFKVGRLRGGCKQTWELAVESVRDRKIIFAVG